MKHIKLFETIAAYNAATLDLPNVSLTVDNNTVHYNPYVELVETRVVTKYYVYDTSDPTQLFSEGSENEFSAIEIDGVEQPSVVSEYTFDTVGEHTVKYTLTDPTSIGAVFYNRSDLISIDIPDNVTSIDDYAFDQSGLESCTIGSGVTSLGESTFTNIHSLESFTIMATTPPSANSIFGGEMSTPTIYVPSASVEAYKAAEGWSEYEDCIFPIS